MAEPWLVAGLAAVAGIIGGAMNALAGGGTFATMPTLVALGLPSTTANATSNVALQPGAIAAAWTYRKGLAPLGGVSIPTLVITTLIGATIGSLLLVWTPSSTFDIVIPWLLLIATLAMMFGKRASDALHDHVVIGTKTMIAVQLLLGIYGGYFGGGVGLMMMAAWSLLAGTALHQLPPMRTLQLAVANGIAAIIFVVSGLVDWTLALPMLGGSIIGGLAGARLGSALSPRAIRAVTLIISASVSIAFFWRAYR